MKKKLLLVAMCAALALGATACGATAEAPADNTSKTETVTATVEPKAPHNVTTAEGAIEALMQGNEAYRAGKLNMNATEELRTDLATNGQKPHTIVITCSDSRVPVEVLFNSNPGEVFVIRTAGNVVSDFEIGSVEYAADHLGSPLVLVMGHSSCGAVGAAAEGHAPGFIGSIVDEVAPSIEKARETETDEKAMIAKAEDLNVENTINNLKKSDILNELVKEGKLTIKGAKFDINSGEVAIFDDAAEDNADAAASDAE